MLLTGEHQRTIRVEIPIPMIGRIIIRSPFLGNSNLGGIVVYHNTPNQKLIRTVKANAQVIVRFHIDCGDIHIPHPHLSNKTAGNPLIQEERTPLSAILMVYDYQRIRG